MILLTNCGVTMKLGARLEYVDSIPSLFTLISEYFVQLGQWTPTFDLPDKEDMLANPLSVNFSPEIEKALEPALDILTKLLHNPDSVNPQDAPVLNYLRQPCGNGPMSHLHKAGFVPFRGDVIDLDQARATNWFELRVPDAHLKQLFWIGKAPFAHTITVLLRTRHGDTFRNDPKFPSAGSPTDQEHFLLKKAWEYQQMAVRADFRDVDIDRESIGMLEERMFEISKEAGRAGYYQWGLDAGDHQDKWFPYENVPSDWDHRDGEFDDNVDVSSQPARCDFVLKFHRTYLFLVQDSK